MGDNAYIQWCRRPCKIRRDPIRQVPARVRRGGASPRRTRSVGTSAEPKAARRLTDRLSALPELRQLSPVSGEWDCIAVLRAETPSRLDALLHQIGAIEGVQ